MLEVAACITGFVYWKKLAQSHWKYFPVYLAIIVIVEAAGKYLSLNGLGRLNGYMYNYVAIPLQVLFFNWLFYKEFTQTRFRWLPVFSAGIYLAAWGAESFLFHKTKPAWLWSFSYSVGIILLVVLVLAFLYLLTTTGNSILFIKNNMMFWVCIGIFVFYFCTLPFFGLGNYLYQQHRGVYFGYARATYFMNGAMYSLFIIAFIWGKPKLSFLSS